MGSSRNDASLHSFPSPSSNNCVLLRRYHNNVRWTCRTCWLVSQCSHRELIGTLEFKLDMATATFPPHPMISGVGSVDCRGYFAGNTVLSIFLHWGFLTSSGPWSRVLEKDYIWISTRSVMRRNFRILEHHDHGLGKGFISKKTQGHLNDSPNVQAIFVLHIYTPIATTHVGLVS